jgi:hypothetical protein
MRVQILRSLCRLGDSLVTLYNVFEEFSVSILSRDCSIAAYSSLFSQNKDNSKSKLFFEAASFPSTTLSIFVGLVISRNLISPATLFAMSASSVDTFFPSQMIVLHALSAKQIKAA